MSADNWSVCPRCREVRAKELAGFEADVENAYGKVESYEYLEMLARRDLIRQQFTEMEANFREDYEFDWEDGILYISWKGSCRICSLSLSFKEERQLYP